MDGQLWHGADFWAMQKAYAKPYRRYSYAIFKGNELIEEYPADENQY